jgi:hypothetical protein
VATSPARTVRPQPSSAINKCRPGFPAHLPPSLPADRPGPRWRTAEARNTCCPPVGPRRCPGSPSCCERLAIDVLAKVTSAARLLPISWDEARQQMDRAVASQRRPRRNAQWSVLSTPRRLLGDPPAPADLRNAPSLRPDRPGDPAHSICAATLTALVRASARAGWPRLKAYRATHYRWSSSAASAIPQAGGATWAPAETGQEQVISRPPPRRHDTDAIGTGRAPPSPIPGRTPSRRPVRRPHEYPPPVWSRPAPG